MAICSELQYLFNNLKSAEKAIKSIETRNFVCQIEEILFFLDSMTTDIKEQREFFSQLIKKISS